MSFFSRTIRKYLEKQIKQFRSKPSNGRKMIFMISAMPEQTILSIADAITSHCLQDHDIQLTLKIATSLTDTWSRKGQYTVLKRGWKDERGNLTYYRNMPETPDKCTLIVLCGADRVTDAAGLADFHTCTPDMIWHVEMKKRFHSWISEKLYSVGIHDSNNDDLENIDRLIKPILTCGHGDLLQISDWLEKLDLNHVANITDISRIILGNLEAFGLPLLTRFPLSQKQKSLSLYINKSAEFYNYTLFLEARQRDKAIKAIDNIFKAIAEGEEPDIPLDDEDVCVPYDSREEFLKGLKKYIETNNQEERRKLLQCNFIIIWDKILKFKTQEKKEKRESIRKLSGSPVEVLLTSIWMTLRDLYREYQTETEIKITDISIKTDLFKHDIEDGNNVRENSEQAQQYLTRLIGGIDWIMSQQIRLNNADGSEIKFRSNLLSPNITCKHSKSAEPVLEFSIEIASELDVLQKKFGWRLPEHHMSRLSAALLLRAKRSIGKIQDTYKLPVYHLSYYEELLQTTSDEETRRVLLHSIQDERESKKFLTNLLSDNWTQEEDPLTPQLRLLAEKYDRFVGEAASRGIFSTIFSRQPVWSDLRKAYAEILKTASTFPDICQSSLVGMLTRAFLIIKEKNRSEGEAWHAYKYEKSGVVTILHPSVVEMLEAQVVYLTKCFNYLTNKNLGNKPGKDSFKVRIWRTYVDLSNIQSPLTGLFSNRQFNLDVNVRGRDLIHRIGSSGSSETPLSTRLPLQYNQFLDDENPLSDTEIFRETSESKLLQRLMQDYFDLHPHARDSLSIAVFRNKNIQPVIASVHAYLKVLAEKLINRQPNKRYVLNDQRSRPYAISVTLFTESNDETDVSSWVQQWRECWEAAETETKYHFYKRCRFSIAHRIVKKDDELKLFQKLIKEQFEADIAVFYNFIAAGESAYFDKVDPFDVISKDLKFPILEKACCTIKNQVEEEHCRKRVISNRQFDLGTYHSNLLHSLHSRTHQSGTIVVGVGDFTPWRNLIDSLHQKAEWVICIDPNMDERLIKEPFLESGKKREIIGFGSGVGTHGEDNYTVSTERFSFADIHYRLKSSIKSLYANDAGWSSKECEGVAKGILNVAAKLSGLSLVRATGFKDEYIRDFMAYALAKKMLQSDNSFLCESLFSLDAYRHWFDSSENMRRPDLLWIRAKAGKNNRLHIMMHLVECKMGRQSLEHLNNAKIQIENGLKVLSSSFTPLQNATTASSLEDERPDQRYWWMQLHRLVASKTEISKTQYSETLAALERLAEGDFDISWEASIFAFWINQDTEMKRIGYWKTASFPSVMVNVYSIGGRFVQRLATDPTYRIHWGKFDTQGDEFVTEGRKIVSFEIDDDDTPWEDDEEPEDNNNETPIESYHGDDLSSATESPQISLDINNENKPKESIFQEITKQPPKNAGKLNIFDRILLGQTVGDNRPIYWEFGHSELANRHMLIFGASGQGKTYAIQSMLCEMTKFRQNSLIIDYTNGFLPNHLEDITKKTLDPQQHVVRQKPLPINPFLPLISDNGGIIINEKANSVAKRIAGLFNSVYNIGDQQYSILHQAIMDGIDSSKKNMNLNQMMSIIEKMTDDRKYKSSAQTLYNKLNPFVLDDPFSHGEDSLDWDILFLKEDPLCNIFQLAGMDNYSGRLITEFILWDLYGHLQSKGRKTDPKVIVLDEIQNLDHNESSPLSKYLREGRKFGLSLILATQTMSNMKKDERDRMFNAEHKLFFKPTDTELKSFANIAAQATRQKVGDWTRKLSSLKKGECFSIGPTLDVNGERLVTRAWKIRITALEERSFNE